MLPALTRAAGQKGQLSGFCQARSGSAACEEEVVGDDGLKHSLAEPELICCSWSLSGQRFLAAAWAVSEQYRMLFIFVSQVVLQNRLHRNQCATGPES